MNVELSFLLSYFIYLIRLSHRARERLCFLFVDGSATVDVSSISCEPDLGLTDMFLIHQSEIASFTVPFCNLIGITAKSTHNVSRPLYLCQQHALDYSRDIQTAVGTFMYVKGFSA